jgi:AcrR family transcriptional regulator
VPRVSTAHVEQIRGQIVESALRVVTERGYHDATIADVVRDSGLSVGAIYTYFTGKEELFTAACELAMEQELAALAGELASVPTVREKFQVAVRHWFDYLDQDELDARFMVDTWAQAVSQPRIRDMLCRRRERLLALGALLLREAVVAGDIPADLDLDALAHGFSAVLDGLLLQRLEEGGDWRRARAERRATIFIDLLYALGANAAAGRPGGASAVAGAVG